MKRAKSAIATRIEFPPRGGHHNQWYQCEACQVALKTVDDTHHKCPLCAKIYSGYPFDDVVFTRRHYALLRRMLDSAWAYAITTDQAYAEYAAKVLCGYAARYLKYPYHANTRWNVVWRKISGGRLFEQTLSEASCMANYLAPAYDLIHSSTAMTPDRHRAIRGKLIKPMLKNIDKYKAGVNNWQTWHNAAMFAGGVMLHDIAWMRKAIYGESRLRLGARTMSWAANTTAKSLKKAGNGFLFQLDHSVSSDGMWYENSWGYHFYSLSALVITAESARRVGLDVWHHPRLKSLFDLPTLYTMADGTLPRFGDDVNSRAQGRQALFEPAYAAFHDTNYLKLLGNTPSWHNVMHGRDLSQAIPQHALGSTVLEKTGHAILRTGGQAGITTAFTFSPYGGFHGHFDKLSFVMFAYGHELAVDPGRARSQAYRLPIHKQWYKATISHNAVLVDGVSQKAATGSLALFREEAGYAAVAATCNEAYRGVRHSRLLIQRPGYLLVVDRLRASRKHRYDWMYHNRGREAHCSLASDHVILGELEGGEYIKDTASEVSDAEIRITFPGKGVALQLLSAAAPGTMVTTGHGVGASVTDRVPLAILTRHGRDVVFASVLEPAATGDTPAVKEINASEADGVICVTVEHSSGQDVYTTKSPADLRVMFLPDAPPETTP
ncbi:MAG: alginate lyase family protein [Lentisphaerae bacterium]|nr:alginate lyase family protein [Lentisphaerota bacterium]